MSRMKLLAEYNDPPKSMSYLIKVNVCLLK